MGPDEVKKYERLSLFLTLAPLSMTYAIAAQRQPALVFGALLTSCSVFEGFLNYLGRTLRIRIDGRNSTNPNAVDLYILGEILGCLEDGNASQKRKVDEIFTRTKGQKAPWGETRFQHLQALVTIRNLITHPKEISSLLPPAEAGMEQSPEELKEYATKAWKKDILWKNLVDWKILSDPTHNESCTNFSDALMIDPTIAKWGHNIVAKIVQEIWECIKHKETGGHTERFALIAGLIKTLVTIEDKHIEDERPDILMPHWMKNRVTKTD